MELVLLRNQLLHHFVREVRWDPFVLLAYLTRCGPLLAELMGSF
jgi:hypothetical protein